MANDCCGCEDGARGPQGIQGPKGDKGDKGDIGLTGSPGLTGADGLVGAKGDKGDPGVQGPKGDKGDKGDPGISGANGLDGADGADGAQGLQGEQGEQGVQGFKGEDGKGIINTVWTSNSAGSPQNSEGTTDTYTITYTDGTTDTFTVYNGADGGDGGGSSAKPELYIYPGTSIELKRRNGAGIGKNNAGSPGLIDSSSLTIEIPNSLIEGDQVVWDTRISDTTLIAFKLKMNGNYLIGDATTWAPIQSTGLSFPQQPVKVEIEVTSTKFIEDSQERFSIKVNQINYFDPSVFGSVDTVTTSEDNIRYSGSKDNDDSIYPMSTMTFPVFIGILNGASIDNLTLEIDREGGGGALGLDYSVCRLTQA